MSTERSSVSVPMSAAREAYKQARRERRHPNLRQDNREAMVNVYRAAKASARQSADAARESWLNGEE